MLKLVAGLMIFLGVHSIRIVAPGWRDRMIARLGVGGWKGLYSLASIAGFVLIVGGYAAARLEPVVLYNPPYWLRHVMMLLMLPVFPLLVAASTGSPPASGRSPRHPPRRRRSATTWSRSCSASCCTWRSRSGPTRAGSACR